MAEDRMLSDEILLGLIKKNGGGGGTTNYNLLENKPQIAGTELQGNKSLADLGIASAQSVSNITNGESINNFAGVETALSNKQGKLTAGSHIEISDNEVSVNRYAIPAGDIVYRAVTVNATTAYVDKYTSGGTFIERINITVNTYQTQDVESKIRFYREFDGWVITLLANSKEHNAGYSYSARSSSVASENDFTFTLPQVEDDNDLIIREELDKKADTDMVAADFNAGTSYTAGNYCVQDGKLYKFKNNHSGAWSVADVDEVKITGELSSLKSGLTNAENSIVTPSCGYTKLGSGAIDGSNPVVVSLGNNNILDYDALYICVAYYESGIATYGSLMIPSLIAKDLYSADAGVLLFAKNDGFNDIVSIGVLLHMGNNNITFSPSAKPAGGHYIVFGFKWRTSN